MDVDEPAEVVGLRVVTAFREAHGDGPVLQLLTAAQLFSAQAGYQSSSSIMTFDGMKSWHPKVEMFNPAAAWDFVSYDGYKRWLLVQWSDDVAGELCFIRVMTTRESNHDLFEFYARVRFDGTMSYRTETRGELNEEVQEFVRRLGIEPRVFDPSQSSGPVTYDPTVMPPSTMASSEREFTPEQAELLAAYLIEHIAGVQ